MQNLRSPILIAASLLALAACGEGEPEPGPPARPHAAAGITAWPATQTTDRGNFDVTAHPVGGVIEKLEHFSLGVSVVAKDGGAGDLSVVVGADMPAHRHGMNTEPELATEAPGRYRIDGMFFHMSGEWVITVDVKRGGETERASFPVLIE